MTENVNKLPKAILFDWDNTLVDTWPVIHDAMNVTLKYMGCDGWDMVETRKRVRRACSISGPRQGRRHRPQPAGFPGRPPRPSAARRRLP